MQMHYLDHEAMKHGIDLIEVTAVEVTDLIIDQETHHFPSLDNPTLHVHP